MPEGLENFTGIDAAPVPSEQAGESDEKFREQYRQSQAAIKQMRQDESKKKQDDATLADLIVKFLNDPAHQQFFLLMCKLAERNIPSDLILAIIALIYQPAQKLMASKSFEPIITLKSAKKVKLSAQINNKIDAWIENIFLVASAEPEKVARSALDAQENTAPELIEFSVFVLRECIASKGEEAAVSKIEQTCRAFWKKLLAQLYTHTGYRGLLHTGKLE